MTEQTTEQITENTAKILEYRTEDDFKVWGEPCSPRRWNEQLATIGGKCPLGDQRLRIVWGATAKKDGFIQTEQKSVPCRQIKYPVPGISKVKKLKGFNYYGQENSTVFVARADQVPQGRLAMPVYEYLTLGMLRWILERKFTVAELVAAQMRPDPDSLAGKMYGTRDGRRYIAPTDPRGEYVALFPLETPDGNYFEPDDRWFDVMRKTQAEVESGEKDKYLRETLQRFEEQEAAQKKAELVETFTFTEDALIEAEKAAINKVYSI